MERRQRNINSYNFTDASEREANPPPAKKRRHQMTVSSFLRDVSFSESRI